jgi:hypothetical protein
MYGKEAEYMFILVVNHNFYFPYGNKVKGGITLYKENDGAGAVVENTKTRSPYPNKNYRAISLRNWRSVCNIGVPLIFDSFEKLRAVRRVKVEWRMERGNIFAYVFDVDFARSENENKRVYNLCGRDLPSIDRKQLNSEPGGGIMYNLYNLYDDAICCEIEKTRHRIVTASEGEKEYNEQDFALLKSCGYDVAEIAKKIPYENQEITIELALASVTVEPEITHISP